MEIEYEQSLEQELDQINTLIEGWERVSESSRIGFMKVPVLKRLESRKSSIIEMLGLK